MNRWLSHSYNVVSSLLISTFSQDCGYLEPRPLPLAMGYLLQEEPTDIQLSLPCQAQVYIITSSCIVMHVAVALFHVHKLLIQVVVLLLPPFVF